MIAVEGPGQEDGSSKVIIDQEMEFLVGLWEAATIKMKVAFYAEGDCIM